MPATSAIDALEGRYRRVYPLMVLTRAYQQFFGALFALFLPVVLLALAIFLWLGQIEFNWQSGLAVAIGTAGVAGYLLILQLFASVANNLWRWGAGIWMVLLTVGVYSSLALVAIGAGPIIDNFSQIEADNPLLIAPVLVFAAVLSAFVVHSAWVLFRAAVFITCAPKRDIAVMRTTPSSSSLSRRLVSQFLGLPPLYEFTRSNLLRYLAIVVVSIWASAFLALASVLMVAGPQTALNIVSKSAELSCIAPGSNSQDCTSLGVMWGMLGGGLVIPALILPLLGLATLLQLGVRKMLRFSLRKLQEVDPRPPVLFLRAFADDQVGLPPPQQSLFGRLIELGRRRENLDHMLLEEATPYGPLVALGNPGDPFPPYGAARGYFKHKDWKQAVADLAARAEVIVFCVDRSDGVKWEIAHIAAEGLIKKTLFLIHPKHRDAGENARLMAELADALGYDSDAGDTPPPLPRTRAGLAAQPVLGFFQVEDGSLRLLYSSTFSRFAYLMAVRMFIREIAGLSPRGLPQMAKRRT